MRRPVSAAQPRRRARRSTTGASPRRRCLPASGSTAAAATWSARRGGHRTRARALGPARTPRGSRSRERRRGTAGGGARQLVLLPQHRHRGACRRARSRSSLPPSRRRRPGVGSHLPPGGRTAARSSAWAVNAQRRSTPRTSRPRWQHGLGDAGPAFTVGNSHSDPSFRLSLVVPIDSTQMRLIARERPAAGRLSARVFRAPV